MQRRRLILMALVLLGLGCGALVIALVFSPADTRSASTERPSTATVAPASPDTDPPVVRIAVAGDTGTRDAAVAATAKRMVLESREDAYDGLLLLGDLIYEDGDADLTRSSVLTPFADVLEDAELIPVLGNHDYRSDEQQQINRALGRDSTWYLENIGPLRIIVLDSNQVENEQQTTWLRNVLAEPLADGTWTVVALHHPPYSAGEHGSDMKVRKAWEPLLAGANVPLVLAGHDHDYQRSSPQNGVTYVVSGAGAKLRPTGREDFTAVSASTLHYLDLAVYRDRLEGRAIDQAGELIDSFTITQ